MEEFKAKVFWLGKIVALGIVLVYTVSALPIQRDDTDSGDWGARSNMQLHTDALTGCQYLNGGGSITPRVDGKGRHLGCR